MNEMKKTQQEKRKLAGKDNLGRILIAAFLLMAIGGGLGQLMAFCVPALIPSISGTDVWHTAEFYLSFQGIWIVTLIFFARSSLNRPMLNAVGTKTKGNTPKMFVIGLAMGLGMSLLCALIAIVNGNISLTFHSFRPVSFLLVFIVVLIQSSAEELLCRVFIYQRMIRRYGKPLLAVVVNAVFFAVLHLFNEGITFLSVLNIFIYGILFSAVVIYMDSPWAAMGIHTAWNFCQNIILGLPNSGTVLPYSVFKLDTATATDSFAYSVGFGLEGTVTSCVVLIAATGLIIWWGIKRKTVPTKIWDAE